MLMSWTEDLVVGEEVLDREHQQLVELANRLGRCIMDRSADHDILSVLNRLVNFADDHFTYEEGIMDRSNYPWFKEYRQEHEAFIQKLLAFIEDIEEHGMKPTAEAFLHLKERMVDHITHQGRMVGAYLQDRQEAMA